MAQYVVRTGEAKQLFQERHEALQRRIHPTDTLAQSVPELRRALPRLDLKKAAQYLQDRAVRCGWPMCQTISFQPGDSPLIEGYVKFIE
jgi:hypothetical protein